MCVKVRPVCFVVDHMLGTLARWLRFLGFDTFYPSAEMEDEEIIRLALSERRVILTRDKGLETAAKRHRVPVLFIKGRKRNEQIEEVRARFDLSAQELMSRCSVCNGLLIETDKAEVKLKVPPGVFERQDEFWMCRKCKKIYWPGSHYEKIMAELKKIQNNHKANE